MNTLITRMVRGLAVLVAAVVPVTVLGITPAHAADHFTVDHDDLVLGKSKMTSYKAFSGTVESWHDGANTRATLTGTFAGKGRIAMTFMFSDGTNQSGETAHNDGTARSMTPVTSQPGKTVVRFTVGYDADADANCALGTVSNVDYPANDSDMCEASPSDHSGTWYVGDSPDSLGTCQQLDSDPVSLQRQGYALLYGKVTYGCTTDGHIVAHVRTTLEWENYTTGSSASARVMFSFADGSQQAVFNPSTIGPATRDNPGQQAITVNFDSSTAKNIRSVQLIVQRDVVDGPSMTSKFGDA